MRDVIEKLLRKYFDIRMILPRTVISDKHGKVTINIYDDLAPNVWNLFEQGSINNNTGFGKLDVQQAEYIQEQERSRIARQVFDMTLTIMRQQSKSGRNIKKEWDEKYGNVCPNTNDAHQILINYSLGALFYMDVLTPFEYDLMEPAFDESGHLLYLKQLPKPETDELSAVIGEARRSNASQ